MRKEAPEPRPYSELQAGFKLWGMQPFWVQPAIKVSAILYVTDVCYVNITNKWSLPDLRNRGDRTFDCKVKFQGKGSIAYQRPNQVPEELSVMRRNVGYRLLE